LYFNKIIQDFFSKWRFLSKIAENIFKKSSKKLISIEK